MSTERPEDLLSPEEIERIVNRLDAEMKEAEEVGMKEGLATGIEWARQASLRDLDRIVDPCELDGDEAIDFKELETMLHDYGLAGLKKRAETKHLDLHGYARGFRDGFDQGVWKIWAQVTRQLDLARSLRLSRFAPDRPPGELLDGLGRTPPGGRGRDL
jgi:hypothetical protein